MKKSIMSVLIVGFSTVATAQSEAMKGMDMQDQKDMKDMDMKMDKKKGDRTVHKGSGTVTKVDPTSNSVTIAHGPVSTTNWPAMSMTFKAKDKSLLEKMKQGEKVDFEFVQQGRDYILTAVK